MRRKILVPLDGSSFAELALPLALSLVERADGELHLVTVASTAPAVSFAGDDDGYVDGWFEEERGRARTYLEEVQGRIVENGGSVPIRTRVLSGSPVPVLDEHIREEGMDLVVMTTHGKAPIERFWLGSVADGLVRHAPCPVLLWRSENGDVDLADRPAFQRIVVPLDGSALSEAMLPEAAALARLFGARMFLLSVLSPSFPLASPYLPHEAEEEQKRSARMESLRSYLEERKADLRKRELDAEVEVASDRDPAEAILDHAATVGADLVAMSTRGRGGVARMVVGSVADKVIRGATVPVFVQGVPKDFADD
jgi:nucleotide-binding universal stress UspA family protein